MPHSTPTIPLRVAIVTGTRAEFGLLLPIIAALRDDPRFRVAVVCAGMHLVDGVDTWREVERSVGIEARVFMQDGAPPSRSADAMALGRGVCGFAEILPRLFDGSGPDWVLLLGDRIEAFAAGAAASVGGFGVAHLHGGDRAEGVADEAMRHAITKLAHLHLPATRESAARIERMGEPGSRVVIVGSPAMCGLDAVRPAEELPPGEQTAPPPPRLIVLHHPSGLSEAEETALARAVGEGVARFAGRAGIDRSQVLWLAPNADAGSLAVVEALAPIADRERWRTARHLPRGVFLSCLASVARSGGALVGNSSAGLIEAAALRVGVVNCGPRQRGRERAGQVVEVRDHAADITADEIERAITEATQRSGQPCPHPYGSGDADRLTAEALLAIGRLDPTGLRKRSVY